MRFQEAFVDMHELSWLIINISHNNYGDRRAIIIGANLSEPHLVSSTASLSIYLFTRGIFFVEM